MNKLSSEESLLLILSKANPLPEDLENTQRIIDTESNLLNWQLLIKKAIIAQTASLLNVNMKRLKNVPDDVLDKLNGIYQSTVRNNILYSHENEIIISELRKNDVPCISLKGTLASEKIFGNLGLYPVGDIDILVAPEHIEEAKRILVSLGYRQDSSLNEKDYIKNHYHLPTYIKDSFFVEVHWNLTKRYFKTTPEFWWEDVREVESNGEKYTILSPERYILYSVFRLYSHGFYPSKFLVFVAELINSYHDDINWTALLEYAARYKMDRLVVFTLKLTGELLGSLVPLWILKNNVFAYEYLKRKVISRMFQENIVHTRNMILYLLLQNDPVNFGIIALKRLFPDASEIRMRYGLDHDSRKIYLYYVLNPILLLIGKKKFLKRKQVN
jgi:hypothetical protein